MMLATVLVCLVTALLAEAIVHHTLRDTNVNATTTLTTTLTTEGYTPGNPSWITRESRAIDRAACQEAICPECGHQGLEYEPWQHARARSYVAVGTCPGCGHTEEF